MENYYPRTCEECHCHNTCNASMNSAGCGFYPRAKMTIKKRFSFKDLFNNIFKRFK